MSMCDDVEMEDVEASRSRTVVVLDEEENEATGAEKKNENFAENYWFENPVQAMEKLEKEVVVLREQLNDILRRIRREARKSRGYEKRKIPGCSKFRIPKK